MQSTIHFHDPFSTPLNHSGSVRNYLAQDHLTPGYALHMLGKTKKYLRPQGELRSYCTRTLSQSNTLISSPHLTTKQKKTANLTTSPSFKVACPTGIY